LKRKGLKRKVLWWFGTVSFIILGLFSLSFRYFINQSIDNDLSNRMRSVASHVQDQYLSTLKDGQTIRDKSLSEVGVAVYRDGRLLAMNDHYFLVDIDKYLMDDDSFFILHHPGDDDYIDVLYILRVDRDSIVVYKKDIDNKIENFEDVLLFLIPVLSILLIFLASKMLDKIIIPINDLLRATQKVTVNDLSGTIPLPKDDDEIKALVVSFNTMIERLREGVETLDRFNCDVSHELKTPLTVIKGEVEVTLRKPRGPREYQGSMQKILYETESIQQIVERLLLLTRYSKGNIKESFEESSLDAILIAVIDKYSVQLEEKVLRLVVERLEPATMPANPSLIHATFSNLIDNAIKFTPSGKQIHISLYKKQKIHFVIKDEGIGISQEEIGKVTDRFYRVDESRSRETRGFGLGLSIVENSVKLHDGTMQIESMIDRGTRVEILF